MHKGIIMIVLLLAPLIAWAQADGEQVVIRLKAVDAELKTEAELQYEEGMNNDNIGWWEETEDEITWQVDIAREGEYIVMVNVSCDTQFPGSTVGVTIGGRKLTFVVPDTETWANYRIMEIGSVTLKPGSVTVLVKADEVVSRFVCNLRSVTLVKK